VPQRARLVAFVLLLAAVFVTTLVVVPRDPERIRAEVDDAGALAPVAFVVAGALLTMAFFPFPVAAAAGGLLFGVAEGTALAVAAETLGATGALLVARYAARDAAARAAGRRLTAVLDAVARRGFSAVLLVRVLPGVPRHPANYAFGLTDVALVAFVAATVLGTTPRALGYAALGGTLGDLTSPESIAAVAGLIAFGALGVWLAARDPELRTSLREARRRGRRRPQL
jgi:uncharacterized membrane protein YdjX (TVP38/TMEM64 family)